MTETRSTCPYCGVGCGVIIESQGDQITGVRGDPDHPANFGRLCTKGSTLHHTAAKPITLQARLLQPAHRFSRQSAPKALSWDAALSLATVMVRTARIGADKGSALEHADRTAAPSKETSRVERMERLDRTRKSGMGPIEHRN